MSRNLRYRYTVKVLTPLHIGSGETIPDVAYHVSQSDSSPCFWTLLDLDAAAVEWSQRNDSTDFSVDTIAEFARKHRGLFRKYTLPVSASIARTLRQSDNRRQRIWEHIKLSDKPYLPGSSLKGAIRTAVLGAFLSQGKRQAFEEAVRHSLKDNRISSPHLSDDAEQVVWSADQHRDPLRGLRIGDSAEVPPQDFMTVAEVRVMGFNTTPKAELFWERLGRREVRAHLSVPHGATPIFLEMLEPKTTLKGELSFNMFLLGEAWVGDQLGFQEKAALLFPEKLVAVCQKKYEDLFQQDLALYDAFNTISKGQLEKVVDNLSNLQTTEAPKENEFFLQLSWGAGWQAKTVADQLDQRFLHEEVNKTRRFFQDRRDRPYALADFRLLTHGQRRLLSPKTRRLVMDGDTPAWPLGWVKVSLEKLPEH
jgi:CRISPR-associated protein Csm5